MTRSAKAKNRDEIPSGWGTNLSRFRRVSKIRPGWGREALGVTLVEGLERA